MRSPDARPAKLLRERLDADGVAAYLRDLAARAPDLEVRIQSANARQSDASTESLEGIGRKLVAGEIAGIQIRFAEGDGWWCDTLRRAKDGYRLVRMREGT